MKFRFHVELNAKLSFSIDYNENSNNLNNFNSFFDISQFNEKMKNYGIDPF